MYLDVNKISDIEIMKKNRHLFVEIFIPQLFLPIICLLTIDLSISLSGRLITRARISYRNNRSADIPAN